MTEVIERRSASASCCAKANTGGSRRVVNGFFVIFALRLDIQFQKAHRYARAPHLHRTCGGWPERANTPVSLTTTQADGARIMADSDNTTTLPYVTRRRVLEGTVVATTAWTLEGNAPASGAGSTNVRSDPALALWREWERVHKQTERLCRKQQRLETRLVESVGFPCVTLRVPEGEQVTVHSIERLHEVLGKGPDTAALREKAETEFAMHQARWNAAAEETGYTAALRAEREACDRAKDFLEAFSTTHATTLAGVAGKLDAVLREGEAWEECSEFPWPQIRSALSDLVRIAEGFGADRERRRRIRQPS
ncbi:hypothetical protein [Mesorhizobium sp. M0296]|uniref:hypothetical protein n=1 Tax=Mesorhizobium sp. M0296 TaxID=2956931 RepID=UPI003337C83D